MSANENGDRPETPKTEGSTAEDSESRTAPLGSSGISYSGRSIRTAGPGMKLLMTWNRIAPFFVSAALFLSGFFSIFAPLPFLILGVTGHWAWLFVAAITNSALVYYSSGPTVFQFYLLGIVSVGLLIPFLIRRRWKPEGIVAFSWIFQWLLVFALICTYAAMHRVSPWTELDRIVSGFFDLLYSSLSLEARDQLAANFGGGEFGIEEWRRNTLIELPGALGILCLLVSWFNLRILVNLNPNRVMHRLGFDRRIFNRWKNAEWLIWPTILSWGVVLFAGDRVSDLALNGFKILMAAYGLQGLAVLGTAFDAWKIRGFFRTLFYLLALFLMMPLVLSVGFFDQWFDFRKKFRQT
jgi:hypothetical protein